MYPSYLLDLVTPEDGAAYMPQGKPPLADAELALIRRWIEQGAVNDSPTPPAAFDTSNPPVYTRPPVITSLDFSPDGNYIAAGASLDGVGEVHIYRCPIDLSLPDDSLMLLKPIGAVPHVGGKLTDEQKKALLDYLRTHDGPLKKLQQELAENRQPRAVDPVLLKLREKMKQAEEPVPLDPGLVRLRRDTELSAKQLEQNRLTMVQDLAWALINSPAFLFNH